MQHLSCWNHVYFMILTLECFYMLYIYSHQCCLNICTFLNPYLHLLIYADVVFVCVFVCSAKLFIQCILMRTSKFPTAIRKCNSSFSFVKNLVVIMHLHMVWNPIVTFCYLYMCDGFCIKEMWLFCIIWRHAVCRPAVWMQLCIFLLVSSPADLDWLQICSRSDVSSSRWIKANQQD